MCGKNVVTKHISHCKIVLTRKYLQQQQNLIQWLFFIEKRTIYIMYNIYNNNTKFVHSFAVYLED